MMEQVFRDKFRPKRHQGEKKERKMSEFLFTHERLKDSCIESASQLGVRDEYQTTRRIIPRAMTRTNSNECLV